MAVERQRRSEPRVRRLIPLSLLIVPALAATALAADHHGAVPARGPSGVTIKPLVKATLADRVRTHAAGVRIRTTGPREVLGTSIVVAPGGTFGWHTHPGPVLVAVASGTLSLFEAHHGACMKSSVGPGQAFVEDGHHVHLARNDGTEPVQIYATFLAPTGTTEFLTPAADPGTCGA
jgi:quercetin dioxygenase-like cupin family protein